MEKKLFIIPEIIILNYANSNVLMESAQAAFEVPRNNAANDELPYTN